VRIFKNKWFQRFARREGIDDSALRDAVERAEKGLIDADLGSGVLKQRIARPGEGKSKGYRTIIFFRAGDRAVFVFGFPKSQTGNISDDEEKAFREAAKNVLSLPEEHLAALIKRGDFVEVKKKDEQKVSK